MAIAYRAIQNGFDALFTMATAMIDDLSNATRHGRFAEALFGYTHPAVLVIDEIGYIGYGPDAANVLFHVVNDRHLRRGSAIFTTNKSLNAWGRVLHDPDLAAAIVDRVLERGGRISAERLYNSSGHGIVRRSFIGPLTVVRRFQSAPIEDRT